MASDVCGSPFDSYSQVRSSRSWARARARTSLGESARARMRARIWRTESCRWAATSARAPSSATARWFSSIRAMIPWARGHAATTQIGTTMTNTPDSPYMATRTLVFVMIAAARMPPTFATTRPAMIRTWLRRAVSGLPLVPTDQTSESPAAATTRGTQASHGTCHAARFAWRTPSGSLAPTRGCTRRKSRRARR
ncbi:MAG: hypothetical protein E7A62_06645 [Actinomycetaceae bacterium]|nr:hypothetical protein [Actinomycetaceae bacterium]MDU0970658.1 hypothetical protein [Actinomycetaceae bacterium]